MTTSGALICASLFRLTEYLLLFLVSSAQSVMLLIHLLYINILLYTLQHICSNIHVQFELLLYKVFKRLISVDMWIFRQFFQ